MRWIKIIESVIYIELSVILIYAIRWGYQSNLDFLNWIKLVAVMAAMVVSILRLIEKLVSEFSKSEEGKLKHSEDLVEKVFEHHAINGFVDFKNDEIIVSFVKWGDPSVEYQAVRHLESGYKEIYREYVNALEYSNFKKIPEIEKKLQEYRNTVEQKLEQIQIPVTETFIDFKTKRYSKKFAKTSIFNEIKNGKYSELVIDPSVFDSDLPSLRWGETTFAVGDMTSLQDLKNTIEKIRNDKEIINIIMDIESKKIQLKNNTALERFNHQKEEIITQVRIKRKPLYGKCDNGRCY